MAYHISLEVFEGPLDLLLNLIEEEEMEIASISLTRIIEQYLTYLQELGELDLATASSFLHIMIELMLLKTRHLLPGEDRKALIQEKKEELVSSLREYKTFRQAAEYMGQLLKKESLVYQRPLEAHSLGNRSYHFSSLSFETLKKAYYQSLERKKREEESLKRFQYPRPETVTIKDQIRFLQEETQKGHSSFHQLTSSLSLQDFIITFLSLLELVRQGEIGVRQEREGGDVLLYARG